jgi:hypothetical protein
MTIQKPVLHARDHMPGGPDPLPGGLGGALEWEDVGAGATGAAYTPHAVFTGSTLNGGLCVWNATPWDAYSPDGQVAQLDPADALGRTLKCQQGSFLGSFSFGSNANFALKQTGDATMSDYLQASAGGLVAQPNPASAGATWQGSNDGFNRWLGTISFGFAFRSTFGADTLTMRVDYLRAAGAITPSFSILLERIS